MKKLYMTGTFFALTLALSACTSPCFVSSSAPAQMQHPAAAMPDAPPDYLPEEKPKMPVPTEEKTQ